jgi:phosphogluconate dehydratase
MDVLLSEQELAKREAKVANISKSQIGMGRELFAGMRSNLTGAETGACSLFVGQD